MGLGKGQIALLLAAAGLLPSLHACSSEPALPWCGPGPREPAQAGGYQLGPGDRLRVAVYRHERLSGESTLDATGTLVMPLLGAIPADGLTPRELELEIEEQLQDDGYLRAPHVGIEVMTHRPFYIPRRGLAAWRVRTRLGDDPGERRGAGRGLHLPGGSDRRDDFAWPLRA